MLRDRELTLPEVGNTDWIQRTSSDEELYWFSIVCHILLPQRTATYAYPLVTLIFSCLYTGINSESLTYVEKRRLFTLAGFITGLLPLIHAHSFLVVGVTAAFFCITYPGQLFDLSKKGHFFLWLAFAIPIILFAFPQIPTYLERIQNGDSHGQSFIKFAPVWRNNPWAETAPDVLDLNFFVLWWKSLTFTLPLSLLGIAFLDVKQRKFYAALLVIFVMANVINFQPWDKDNTKIFAIWMFLASAVAVLALSKLAQVSFLLKPVVAIIFISMIISGTFICIRESEMHNWKFSDQEDYKVAAVVRERTAHDAIFITSDSHLHPITNLAGRTTVYGYGGWLHSHGYPGLWEREQELKGFLRDPANQLKFLEKYNVSYLCWDMTMPNNDFKQEYFDKTREVLIVHHTWKYKVYDLRALRSA